MVSVWSNSDCAKCQRPTYPVYRYETVLCDIIRDTFSVPRFFIITRNLFIDIVDSVAKIYDDSWKQKSTKSRYTFVIQEMTKLMLKSKVYCYKKLGQGSFALHI